MSPQSRKQQPPPELEEEEAAAPVLQPTSDDPPVPVDPDMLQFEHDHGLDTPPDPP